MGAIALAATMFIFAVIVGAITAYFILKKETFDLIVVVHDNNSRTIKDTVSKREWIYPHQAILDLCLPPVIVTSDKWQDIKKGSNGWLACDHKVDDGYNILVSCGDDWVLAWLTADEFDIVHKEDKVWS